MTRRSCHLNGAVEDAVKLNNEREWRVCASYYFVFAIGQFSSLFFLFHKQTSEFVRRWL